MQWHAKERGMQWHARERACSGMREWASERLATAGLGADPDGASLDDHRSVSLIIMCEKHARGVRE